MYFMPLYRYANSVASSVASLLSCVIRMGEVSTFERVSDSVARMRKSRFSLLIVP